MKRTALLSAKLSLLIAATTFGQTWDGGDVSSNNWGADKNWNPDAVPVNNGTANLIFGGTTRLAPNIDTAWSINSLTIDNTAGAFTFGGSPLTINGGGITNNDGSTQVFGNEIVLGANQTWNTASGSLFVNGVVSGGFALTKTGNSTLLLTGANTFSGGTTVSAGNLDIRNASALGTGTLTMAGGNLTNSSGSTITLSTNNPPGME